MRRLKRFRQVIESDSEKYIRYKVVQVMIKYSEVMVMISLLEVQDATNLIVVQVLTQLLTFSQVLIRRQGIASDYYTCKIG
jgi:hypothetical protein